MIRPAKKSDLEKILHITRACALKMEEEGIFQWNHNYPRQETFLNDLQKNQLYVFEEDLIIHGCIVISSEMDLEYNDVDWLTPSANNYYIHRLAVDPQFQGKGIARSLMDFAEKMAIENRANSIRLDTFSGNRRNKAFYEARTYKKLDSIYYPEQSRLPFYCYELILQFD